MEGRGANEIGEEDEIGSRRTVIRRRSSKIGHHLVEQEEGASRRLYLCDDGHNGEWSTACVFGMLGLR